MRLKFKAVLLLVILAGAGGALWKSGLIGRIAHPMWRVSKAEQADATGYEVLKSEAERWKARLSKRYQSAEGAARREVEHDAAVVLETLLPEMIRCWLGTPWAFEGTSDTPGEGEIACGYFVATVLRDAGFVVDRYKLAQQPSSKILHTFVPERACMLTVGEAWPDFAARMNRADRGVWLVGLDTHVGFLVTSGDGFRFLHSSGSAPYQVVDEASADAAVLQRSSWRMTGRLLSDKALIRKWLTGETLRVAGVKD